MSLLHAAYYSVLVPLFVVPSAEINIVFAGGPQGIEDPCQFMGGGGDSLRGTETGTDQPVETPKGRRTVGE